MLLEFLIDWKLFEISVGTLYLASLKKNSVSGVAGSRIILFVFFGNFVHFLLFLGGRLVGCCKNEKKRVPSYSFFLKKKPGAPPEKDFFLGWPLV